MAHNTEDNSIDLIFTKEFFVQNRYNEVLNAELKKLDTRNASQMCSFFKAILNLDDAYITIYLMEMVNPKCRFITNEILTLLGKFVDSYNSNYEFNLKNVDTIATELLRNNLCKSIRIDVFIENVHGLDYSESDVEYYKDTFGYSTIYKYYKEIINNMFEVSKSFTFLGLLIKMLDNSKLVYESLLPVLKRLTTYVSDNFVDKNLVQAVEALKSIIKFEPSIFRKRVVYIESFTSFLIRIFENPNNYKYLSYSDCKKITKGIDIFAHFCENNSSSLNLLNGIYRNVFDVLRDLVNRKTTVFEEFMSITCFIEILHIYYEILNDKIQFPHDADDVAELLQQIIVKKPKGVTESEWKIIRDRFYLEKYKFMCKIEPKLSSVKINSDQYNEAVLKCTHTKDLLHQINNIFVYIEWDYVLPEIIKAKRIQSFAVIFHAFENSHGNESSLIKLINVFATEVIKAQNYDLILYSVSKLTSVNLKDENRLDSTKILLRYFVHTIDVYNDQRITKSRIKIQEYVFYRLYKEAAGELLDEYINQLDAKNYIDLNINVLSMFLVLAKKHRSIRAKSIDLVCRYLIQSLTRNEPDTEKISLSKISQMYLATICEIMIFQDVEVCFGKKDYESCPNTFYKLVIACITCSYSKNKKPYLEKFIDYLLGFIFTASHEQRRYLGALYKKCNNDVLVEDFNLDELFSLCVFLRKKYDLI